MAHSRSVEHRLSSSFGALLRRYRAEANLTQRELASRAGLSPRTVSDLERGINQRPMAYTMRQLADALELEDEERHAFEAAARGDPSPPTASQEEEEIRSIPSTLPAPVAPFVGRVAELEVLAGLLHRPDVRLLTLVGPGGTGKTRLAIEAAGAARSRYPDGVYFIPLASLGDPRLLVSTIAHALGIRESAGQTIEEALVQVLRPKQLLLLLDNLEHLVEATPEVTGLLEACPALTVLLTSRVVLHLSGEYLFPVPPMTLPPDEEGIGLEELARYDATALFIERAAAVDPGFAGTSETAPLIAALCARLDGLPLAIELAAAQSRLFPPATLLARLTSGTEGALGEGPRDVPARQHTLRDTIDWSYRLLSEEDQRLFAQLSVFAGGCTSPAAQAVCASDDEGDVVQGISHLADATLIGQERTEQLRIGMLETIREYAAERLRQMGEEEKIRQRHAAFYTELAEVAWTELMGPKQAEWLARLDTEYANLRAALAWLLDHDTGGALEMSSRLREFWRLRGYWEEGVTWLEASLVRGQAAPVLIRGRAAAACGWLWFCRGEHRRAFPLLEDGLALLREADVAVDVGRALYSLGFMHMEMGDLEEAQACFDESLVYSEDPRAIGERSATLASLSSLAYMRGDYQEAVRLAEEAVDGARESGVATRLMYALGDLGTAATGLEDYERAEDALQEALTYSRQLGVPAMSAACLGNLGELAWEQGDFARAHAYQERSVAIAREIGDSHVTAIGLHNLAKALVSLGDAQGAIERLGDGLRLIREQDGEKWLIGILLRMFAQALSADGEANAAVRLWAVSGRILAEVGFTPSLRERELEEQTMERAQTMLDEAAWQQAWDVGEAMTLNDGVDFALAQTERESPSVQSRGA